MKNIFKFFRAFLMVVFAASLTGCLAEDQLESADVGLHVKVVFPTKVVAGQPMTINGSGFSETTEIVFPGEIVVTDFQIVSNDMIRVTAPKGIAAEGGKILVRTADGETESPLPITLGKTVISGYSAEAGMTVDGGSQITVYGTDLEFVKAVELLDADGNPALVEDKTFNRKSTDNIIFTVPKKVYEGTFVGKLHTIDGQVFNMPELTYKPAADGGYWETQKIMIWENDGTYGQIAWSSDYRFALEGTNGNGDAIVAEIPAATWAILKDGTFYMTISGGDAYQIRINTGWWSFDGDGVYDIHNGDERLVDNGDGTFTLAVTMSEEPLKSGIYDLVDVQHLLFTGSGYTIHNLYYTEDVWVEGGGSVEIVRTSIWKNDGTLGEGTWGNTYRFALEGTNGGDASVDVPADLWALMKNGPFHMQIQPVADWWQIRVLTGWWSAQWPTDDNSGNGDINVNWTDIVADNGDGTFKVTLDFTGHAILDAMDEQNLLFAGAGFQILEIYVEEEVFVPGGGGEPAEVVVWENDGSFPSCNWGGHYRFGLEGMDSLGECAATFPADVWERLKSAPFNILITPVGDWFSIRVMDGWWSVGNDQSGARDLTPNTEGVVNNGDGTWVVPIALPEDLLPVLDAQHLLFSGGEYTILKIYYYE
ncbi:MAG: hypothetical protein IKY48_03340 [Bacteroidales bacterium]|nr:hypothetical protein [Bacteroidales bacterium]